MTITLPNLPPHVEAALRSKAQQENRPIDQVILDALAKGLGLAPAANLGRFAGSMTRDDAQAIEQVVREMDATDLAARDGS